MSLRMSLRADSYKPTDVPTFLRCLLPQTSRRLFTPGTMAQYHDCITAAPTELGRQRPSYWCLIETHVARSATGSDRNNISRSVSLALTANRWYRLKLATYQPALHWLVLFITMNYENQSSESEMGRTRSTYEGGIKLMKNITRKE